MITAFSLAPSTPSRISANTRMKSTRLYHAMERLHNPSSNAFGSLEHIFSLQEIDAITQKIADDEWMALGSVMAETLLETILDVGEDALNQRGWVERMSVTNRIAEEVSSAIEVCFFIHLYEGLCYQTSLVGQLTAERIRYRNHHFRNRSTGFVLNQLLLLLLAHSSIKDSIIFQKN